MKIVACIKQVPAGTGVSIDPETGRLIREGVESVVNPFDLYALEEGVLLRQKYGGEVVSLTMGPASAAEAAKEALACGADKAVVLSDRLFAGSDTWATSYILAEAIKKIGDVDLVLCGKQAIDGDTAQVGPGIAVHLGRPQAMYVTAATVFSEGRITVNRKHEYGYDIMDLELPAVLSFLKGANSPRIPTLKDRLLANRAEILVWTAADIGADPERIGLAGSLTKVVKTKASAIKARDTLVIQEKPGEAARSVLEELEKRSLL
jgi:electron transfer flavoprotein beta subunit